jgi:GGDEF domain-containing protein
MALATDGDTCEVLLRRSDEAMYRAKRVGGTYRRADERAVPPPRGVVTSRSRDVTA